MLPSNALVAAQNSMGVFENKVGSLHSSALLKQQCGTMLEVYWDGMFGRGSFLDCTIDVLTTLVFIFSTFEPAANY